MFALLHEEMVSASSSSGRPYVIGGAAGWLLDQYVQYGWRRTGVTYASRMMGLTHEFIFLDTRVSALASALSGSASKARASAEALPPRTHSRST